MTLVEKFDLLQKLLKELHVKSAEAFTIQGLYREPKDFIIKDIPNLIRLIRTEDFQFRFDFKSLDSVGTIRARLEGEPSGYSGIEPSPFAYVFPTLNNKIILDFNVGAQHVTLPNFGAWGTPTVTFATDPRIFEIHVPKMEFHIESIPDSFIPAALNKEPTYAYIGVGDYSDHLVYVVEIPPKPGYYAIKQTPDNELINCKVNTVNEDGTIEIGGVSYIRTPDLDGLPSV